MNIQSPPENPPTTKSLFHSILRLSECILLASLISLTLLNLPNTILRLHSYFHSIQIRSKQDKIWHSLSKENKQEPSIFNLPVELTFSIFEYLDTRSLVRLSKCSKALIKVGRDEGVWRMRVRREWPDFEFGLKVGVSDNGIFQSSRISTIHDDNIAIHYSQSDDAMMIQSAYEIYKSHWIYFGCTTLDPKEDTIHNILASETLSALHTLFQVSLIPLKVCGLATIPIFLACSQHAPTRNSTTLAFQRGMFALM